MHVLPPPLQRALLDREAGLTILVVRLGALGDVLRTIPPVRLIRSALPRAAIRWVADDRWSAAVLDHPDLTEVILLPRRDWDRQRQSPLRWPALIRSVRGFTRRLRETRPDLVLDFHGNLRSGIVGRLSGAPVRLGYGGHQAKEGNRWLSTHRVPSRSRRTPRMERNLAMVRALGIPDAPLPVDDHPLARAGRPRARRILEGTEGLTPPFAVVNPGASPAQAYKKPPSHLLSKAAFALAERGVTPLVVWGPGEEPDARAVAELAGPAAVLAPPTDLSELAALLERARLYVGGDTGPLHLACSVGCPVVALYGPTDPVVNAPWGVPSRAVFPEDRVYTGIKRLDRRAGGFEGLTAEQLLTATDSLLTETATTRPQTG